MGVGQAGAKKKEAYRKQEMIQWETIEQDIEAYLRSQSQEEWRSAFIPLMEGVVQDQGQRWAARLGMQFDVRNVEAEQWFQDYTMKFAADVSLTTENEVRNVIGQGMAEGWSIGEMSSHLDDVFSYWQDGPASGLITPEEWDWYEQRRPFYRREMIARTETIRASNRGTEEHWKRWAIEGKEWIVAHDDRLCPWCAEMDGQIIGIQENFWNQGDTMAINIGDRVARLRLKYEDVSSPPLHPNCRCTIIPWKQEWEEVGVAPPEGLDVWGGADLVPPVEEGQVPSHNVGEFIDLSLITGPRGKVGGAVRRAIADIEAVHGTPEMLPVPVKQVKGARWYGMYSENRRTGDPARIQINYDAPGPQLTAAHEIGHYIDNQAFGVGPMEGSALFRQVQGVSHKDEWQGWWDACQDSEAIRNLRDLRAQGQYSYTLTMSSGKAINVTKQVDKRWIDYAVSSDETFARSYSQWIATKQGGRMREELDRAVAKERSGYLKYTAQWEDEDFKPIGEAFDKLFKAAGWLR